MERFVMFLIVAGIISTAVFAIRNLKFIPNYKSEYLLEFNQAKKINKITIERINGIYQIHQINEQKYRVRFDAPLDQLKTAIIDTLSLNSDDIVVTPVHSWLKTNAWK